MVLMAQRQFFHYFWRILDKFVYCFICKAKRLERKQLEKEAIKQIMKNTHDE